MELFAVHLSDFLLSAPWWVSGWLIAVCFVAWSSYHIHETEFAPLALLSAVFFVSSSIHIRLGPTAVHLLLNGLIGTMLRRRAVLAISLGLCLQTVLLQHGGFMAMGLNIIVMAIPAMIVPMCLRRGLRQRRWVFLTGFLIGFLAVLLTITLHAGILYFGGIENLAIIAQVGFIAHLPLAIIEGMLLGGVCQFLHQVKPELMIQPDVSI